MNLTEEQLDAWEKELERETAFLIQHGWTETPDYKWLDPEGKLHDCQSAYDHLMERVLDQKGWRTIIQQNRTGEKHHLYSDEYKMARYQSPVTKRIYTYLDARYIAENGWDESCYPDKCCGMSRMLTELVGENFSGNEIETWFHRKDGVCVLEWWE